jgi:hypothetical protein
MRTQKAKGSRDSARGPIASRGDNPFTGVSESLKENSLILVGPIA